jgi:tRNA-binding protein
MISYDDFLKVDVRVGRIIKAEPFPEARNPAYKLFINFGEEIGKKKTSAQITQNYSIEDLEGKLIAAVVNFPPKQIGPFMSEVLTLGFMDENDHVVLVSPDKNVPLGGRLH